jgi:hypothetical protein
VKELESKLVRLGVVSLNLATRGRQHIAVARLRGGRAAVVTSRVSLEVAVGRVLTVLGAVATKGEV